MKRQLWLSLWLCLAFGIGGCSQPGQTGPGGTGNTSVSAGGHLPIVASFSILGDIVQHVGGDYVTVTTLVGPNGDAHTFEPSPADSATLSQAALIVQLGVGFEPWLDSLVKVSGSSAQRVDVSAGIPLLTFDQDSEERGEFDPHIWHDVTNVMTMTRHIRDGLVAADPAHAAAYTANAESYLITLRDLDSWVMAQVQLLPPEQRKLVTSHDTFAYFARRYGFQIIGSGLGSLSTETGDPSAAQMVDLVQRIRAVGVPVIFAENTHNPALMQQIADESGVKLAPPLYTDALDASGTPGANYEGMMRANIQTIVAALKGS